MWPALRAVWTGHGEGECAACDPSPPLSPLPPRSSGVLPAGLGVRNNLVDVAHHLVRRVEHGIGCIGFGHRRTDLINQPLLLREVAINSLIQHVVQAAPT